MQAQVASQFAKYIYILYIRNLHGLYEIIYTRFQPKNCQRRTRMFLYQHNARVRHPNLKPLPGYGTGHLVVYQILFLLGAPPLNAP